jgi:hypothetical protein
MTVIAHNPSNCCDEGRPCEPCEQCIRGAWISVSGFSAGEAMDELGCSCGVDGTYYLPSSGATNSTYCYSVNNAYPFCGGGLRILGPPGSTIAVDCTETEDFGTAFMEWRLYIQNQNILIIVSYGTDSDFFAGIDYCDFYKLIPLDGEYPPHLTDCDALNGSIQLSCPDPEEPYAWWYCLQPESSVSVEFDFGPCP